MKLPAVLIRNMLEPLLKSNRRFRANRGAKAAVREMFHTPLPVDVIRFVLLPMVAQPLLHPQYAEECNRTTPIYLQARPRDVYHYPNHIL